MNDCRVAAFAMLAAAVLALSGCDDKTPSVTPAKPPAAATKAKWSVLVFMNAKNSLDKFSDSNFTEMASVGSSPDVNVAVEWGRLSWKHVYRFRVTKGMVIKRGLEPRSGGGIEDLKDADMGSVEELRSFVKWGIENFPAEHYMLVIWNHGQGWRLDLASDTTRAPKDAITMTSEPAEQIMLATPRSKEEIALQEPLPTYRAVSYDERSGNHLYNCDIESVLTNTPVDVIGFDACLMSMVETGYALRHGGKILVGSEELEPGPGWDYTAWLHPLLDRPTMDAEEVGRTIVNAYQSRYQNSVGSATLSSLRLDKVPSVANATSNLADVLRSKLSDPVAIAKIQAARGACSTFAPDYVFNAYPRFNYVDLNHFAGELSSRIQGQDVAEACKALSNAVTDAVAINWAGNGRVGNSWGCSGVSIYFPASAAAFANDQSDQDLKGGYDKDNKSHPVDFVSDQTIHWADFLHEYFARVP